MPKNEFIVRAPHHFYIGIAMIVFAWLMQPYYYYDPITYFLYGFGIFAIVDDIVEHTICSKTPLRLLFEKIIMPILEKLANK
jgi:hypothetical protein